MFSVKIFQYFNFADPTYNTGYWENESETYPNESEWGANAGLPVRLHRVPSLADAPIGGGAVVKTSVIGAKFDNMVIPAEYAGKIVQLKFYSVKRVKGQTAVVGSGLAGTMQSTGTYLISSATWSNGGIGSILGQAAQANTLTTQIPDITAAA